MVMSNLFVVSDLCDRPFEITGGLVVSEDAYLSDPEYRRCRGFKVFNLSSSYAYQSRGYYVSLLAEARGHSPVPDINAIENMRPPAVQSILLDRSAGAGHGHRNHACESPGKRPRLAILITPDQAPYPSSNTAIRKFIDAADAIDMDAEIITQADVHRLHHYDGLFIRDTTHIHHYTYDMARQAVLAGMVVIDDPDSILRCTNKVYLAEIFSRHGIPAPRTMLVHPGNLADIVPALGLPCVLKRPDGAFSVGVIKVRTEEELYAKAPALLDHSALVIAQEYLPTEFDWRVGVLERRAIFACKYHMAAGHWQIIKYRKDVVTCEGAAEACSIGEVPDMVISSALQAANLIGDGLYGVDLKQIGNRVYVIEINDNPNIDAGSEDGILKDALYRDVMGVFRKRIEAGKVAMHERA